MGKTKYSQEELNLVNQYLELGKKFDSIAPIEVRAYSPECKTYLAMENQIKEKGLGHLIRQA